MHRNRSKPRFRIDPEGADSKHGRPITARGLKFGVTKVWVDHIPVTLHQVWVKAGDEVVAFTIFVFGELYLALYADEARAKRIARSLNRGQIVDLTDELVPVEVDPEQPNEP